MTSFPETVYSRFSHAFTEKYPEVQVYIRSKKTSAAISFIEERSNEVADIFWASAPDAFEVLKQSGSLIPAFTANSSSHIIGDCPIDDPDGYYLGFAISGYGLMWNPPYLKQHKLAQPWEWQDLVNPRYMGHIGMTAPSRSGTTHLIVETILQKYGWEPGWALLSEIGGNLATITARSFGVRDGVKSGRFGIGLVVDFFGLSGKAVGAPVDFLYPDGTIFLPANAAIVRHSSNPSAARAFIDFLRSKAGQKILLEPAISRLPVSESIYQHATPGYPNPFESELLKKGIAFDSQLSRQRYHLVNTLFDLLITYRFSSLRKSWSAIHESEAQLADDADALSRIDIGRARQLLGAVPVSEAKSRAPAINSVFSRRNPGLPVSDQQLDLEKQWYSYIQKNHQLAMQLVTNVFESNHQQ